MNAAAAAVAAAAVAAVAAAAVVVAAAAAVAVAAVVVVVAVWPIHWPVPMQSIKTSAMFMQCMYDKKKKTCHYPFPFHIPHIYTAESATSMNQWP